MADDGVVDLTKSFDDEESPRGSEAEEGEEEDVPREEEPADGVSLGSKDTNEGEEEEEEQAEVEQEEQVEEEEEEEAEDGDSDEAGTDDDLLSYDEDGYELDRDTWIAWAGGVVFAARQFRRVLNGLTEKGEVSQDSVEAWVNEVLDRADVDEEYFGVDIGSDVGSEGDVAESEGDVEEPSPGVNEGTAESIPDASTPV